MINVITRTGITGLVVVVLLTGAGTVFAQFPDQWERHPENPIFPEFGGSTVLFHEGIYKMWGGIGSFNYATSPDGLDWTLHPDSPVLVPGPDWYDLVAADNPSVLVIDGLYHMWYSCVAADDNSRIAHATSFDGIEWTKDIENPVMDLGSPGDLDSNELIHPCVIHEPPLFRMWYNGVGGTGTLEQRILYAVSLDGVSWARDDEPALEPGPNGDWDDYQLYMMNVLKYGATYYMFYTGSDEAGSFGIGYATSPDGNDWEKRTPSEPVFGPGEPGAWDDLVVAAPVVLLTDTEFWMYYGGSRDFESFSWGLATAELVPSAVPGNGRIRLDQNFPNPFNPRTTIQFTLTDPARVILEIYDAAGRHVRRLIDGRMMSAGTHRTPWNGRDDTGREVASGVYFYHFKAGDSRWTKSMVLVK